MTSGFYALASLDGAPLDPCDLAMLDLSPDSGRMVMQADGMAAVAYDCDPHAINCRADTKTVTALLGYLDEPEDLARTLGRSPREPPLDLLLAAIERYGDEAPTQVLGRWTLLQWDALRRVLTLRTSESLRDRLHWACDGKRVAIAPALRRLCRLSWVGKSLDPQGLLLSAGRWGIRKEMGSITVAAGVRAVQPASRLTLTLDRQSTVQAKPWVPGPGRLLSPEDAYGEIEEMLRRVVRQRLERSRSAAALISGGLDSAILAWLLASEQPAGRDLRFLTSVAPPNSGLSDEWAAAERNARHLGVAIEPVMPADDSNVFQPSRALFDWTEAPMMSNNHTLYRMFDTAAAGAGADVLFTGNGGELAVTNHAASLTPWHGRTFLRQMRARLRDKPGSSAFQPSWPYSAFHARLSRDAAATIGEELRVQWQAFQRRERKLRPSEAFGLENGATKDALFPSSTSQPSLRISTPLADPRVLRLVSTMPAGIMRRDGLTRAPARAILHGRLPQEAWQTPAHLPFSPTYMRMIRDLALGQRARLTDYHAVGAGEWIDLEWLDRALIHVSTADGIGYGTAAAVQFTALFGEFLLWWHDA